MIFGIMVYKQRKLYKWYMIHHILKLSMESRQVYELQKGLRSLKSLQIL